jgi:hypothetical protein
MRLFNLNSLPEDSGCVCLCELTLLPTTPYARAFSMCTAMPCLAFPSPQQTGMPSQLKLHFFPIFDLEELVRVLQGSCVILRAACRFQPALSPLCTSGRGVSGSRAALFGA